MKWTRLQRKCEQVGRLIWKRKHLLDRIFVVTPEEVVRMEQVNNRLFELMQKLVLEIQILVILYVQRREFVTAPIQTQLSVQTGLKEVFTHILNPSNLQDYMKIPHTTIERMLYKMVKQFIVLN